MIGKQHFIVTEPIFRQRVHVLLNYDEHDYVRWLNRNKIQDVASKDVVRFSGFASSIDRKDGPSDWLICIKQFEWSTYDQGTLLHEVIHTVFQIFKSDHVPFNDQTQEFVALSVGRLFEAIANRILHLKKRRKKKS